MGYDRIKRYLIGKMENRTDAEILAILESDNLRVEEGFRLMLGDKSFMKVEDILCEGIVQDIDYVLLDGQIPFEELDQFLYVSDEYHEAHTRLYDLCDEIIGHVTRDLDRKLFETKDQKGRYNNKRGLLRINQTFAGGVESLMLEEKTIRNTLVQSLDRYFGQNFYLRVWFAIKSNPRLNKYEGMLRELLSILDRQFLNGAGINCPGVVGISLVNNFTVTLEKHKDLVEDFLSTESDSDINDTKKICDSFIKEAKELSAFRSIDHVSKEIGGVKIHLYGSSKEEETRAGSICRIKISFNKNNDFIETIASNNSPNPTLKMQTSNESFDFILNRYSGELFLGNSQVSLDRQIGKDMGGDFIGELDFYKLKKVILEFLVGYLRSQPEDISRVEVPVVSYQQANVQESVDEILEGGSDKSVDYEYIPYVPTEQEMSEVEAEKIVIQDLNISGSFDEYLSIKTIERLTGIPVDSKRGKGSHMILEGSNGRKFPMPSHKGKDIALPILKKCLLKLNIPYSRFIDEY